MATGEDWITYRLSVEVPASYRAVATDLRTGEMVVLDRGNLMHAMRASMAIPGIFTPVEHEGRLLVDGFLASNVPVDVVREMGADIVIAIDVSRRPEDVSRIRLGHGGEPSIRHST